MVQEPHEIEDEEHEQILGRVAAVDVAKAGGMVCTRVPHPSQPSRRLTKVWEIEATTEAVSGLGEQLAGAGIEKVTTAPELDRTVKRLDTLTQRIDEATATLGRSSKSMESVMARLDRGEGTLGKLTKDDKLYNNLNEAAVNFSKLADDIRKQPRKYINLKVF